MTLFLLRLRTWMGWDYPPDTLRKRAAMFFRMFRFTAVFTAFMVVLPLAFWIVQAPGHHIFPLPGVVIHEMAILAIGYGALSTIAFLPPAVSSWLLARGCRPGETTTIHGRCLAVKLDPPNVFYARIGLSPEHAHWYLLPIDWDRVVEPSFTEYELTVLATGFVERLHRLGASPRELSQPLSDAKVDVGIGDLSEEPADGAHDDNLPHTAAMRVADESYGANDDERRAFRRFARRAPLGWRGSAASFAATGWVFLACGVFAGVGMPIWWLWAMLNDPRIHPDASGRVAIIAFAVALGAIGLITDLAALLLLRTWLRARRANVGRPGETTGEILSWIPYRDMWSPSDSRQRKETLINVRSRGGEEHIYRVPIRFLQRVRERGAWVTVEYLPGTERVLDVRYADTPSDVAEHQT